MRTKVWILMALVRSTFAATHYVDLNSANPTPPYTNWATAATVIQDAVDAAGLADEVVVTNGTYATGGRPAGTNLLSNRVVVDKSLTLRSVNGPLLTSIRGYQVPTNGFGDGAVRCVYLIEGAVLDGFTLTNGATLYPNSSTSSLDLIGAGVWCATSNALVTNCVLIANAAAAYGGGAYGGTLHGCTLSGNSAWFGGGAEGCVLNCCLLSNNFAGPLGGGADSCTLSNCKLIGNSAAEGGLDGTTRGGGAEASVLNDCILMSNSVSGFFANISGGGADLCVLNNCVLAGNSLNETNTDLGLGQAVGGGASDSTLNNCILINNAAVIWYSSGNQSYGGGASGGTLNNCTLSGNWAEYGGGVSSSTLNNCIVYFNSAGAGANYDLYNILNYCCTTPMPNGFGNITNAPLFVDLAGGNLRLQSHSPCINAGYNAFAPSGPDLDGNARIVGGTVDIGAYEYQNPASTISYAWLQQFGLPTDGSADYTDPDGDGMNNWQEWRCQTDPTNPLSVLRLLSPTVTRTNATVTWQSVAGVNYFLARSTNLALAANFSTIATNIVGQSGTTTYADTNALRTGTFFYRVGVH